MSVHQVGSTMQRSAGERPTSGVKRVNKNFLLNTVAGLKSHNRREEEEDCWRQHRLQEQQHPQRGETERSDLRSLINEGRRRRSSAASSASTNSREFWAEMKLRTMVTNSDSGGSTTEAFLPPANVKSSIDSSSSGLDVSVPRNLKEGEKPVSLAGGKEKTKHKRARESDESGDEDDGHGRCKHARKRAREHAHKRQKRKKDAKAKKKKR